MPGHVLPYVTQDRHKWSIWTICHNLININADRSSNPSNCQAPPPPPARHRNTSLGINDDFCNFVIKLSNITYLFWQWLSLKLSFVHQGSVSKNKKYVAHDIITYINAYPVHLGLHCVNVVCGLFEHAQSIFNVHGGHLKTAKFSLPKFVFELIKRSSLCDCLITAIKPCISMYSHTVMHYFNYQINLIFALSCIITALCYAGLTNQRIMMSRRHD